MTQQLKRNAASQDALQFPCPVCRSSTGRCLEKDGFWIRRCTACKFRFLEKQLEPEHVDQVYGDDYFVGGGAGYPDYAASGGLVREHGQRYGRLLKRYMEPGVVLDIGAAAGFFLSGLLDCGWSGDGLEPNAAMSDYGKNKLGANVVNGTLERLPRELRVRQYDLVTMVQVVPHFYDIHCALEAAASVTKRGGYWLVETWNVESFSARVFGRNWHEYSPPSVVRWFSPSNLATLCESFGFQKIAGGRPSKWISGAHAKSLLRHKMAKLPWSLGRHLLTIVPDALRIPYPSEDLFWQLLRKTS